MDPRGVKQSLKTGIETGRTILQNARCRWRERKEYRETERKAERRAKCRLEIMRSQIDAWGKERWIWHEKCLCLSDKYKRQGYQLSIEDWGALRRYRLKVWELDHPGAPIMNAPEDLLPDALYFYKKGLEEKARREAKAKWDAWEAAQKEREAAERAKKEKEQEEAERARRAAWKAREAAQRKKQEEERKRQEEETRRQREEKALREFAPAQQQTARPSDPLPSAPSLYQEPEGGQENRGGRPLKYDSEEYRKKSEEARKQERKAVYLSAGLEAIRNATPEIQKILLFADGKPRAQGVTEQLGMIQEKNPERCIEFVKKAAKMFSEGRKAKEVERYIRRYK